MAKVKEFEASYGLSIELPKANGQAQWHKFGATIKLEIEENDILSDVKEKAWNTVISEVENQFSKALTTI